MSARINTRVTPHRGMRGVTLIELTLALVVIAIAVVGTLKVFNLTTGNSGDPMIREQALLIAESYMEEILLKRFVDPISNTVCPVPPAARSSYNNVCDYNGLSDVGAHDQFGNLIAGLNNYNVAVTVANSGVALNTISNSGAIRVLQIDVTVTGPGATTMILSGYRTNYNCNAAADPGCKPL